jgi:hypothetical protein
MTNLIVRENPTDGRDAPASSKPEAQCPPRTSETFETALRKRVAQTPWEPLEVRLAERMCE